MSVVLTINGVPYDYPEEGDEDWGPDATDWAQAVTQGMLQKAGGLFTLSADADFGASFGLKSLYYKSRSSNVASSGQIRLANTDAISFRNTANNGNLTYGVNTSDQPTFNGNPLAVGTSDVTGPASSTDNAIARFDSTTGKLIQNSVVIVSDTGATTGITDFTVTGTTTLATTLTGVVKAVSGVISAASLVNADVSASAAIAFSKLASLTSAHILVGSAGNVATDVAVTGDIAIDNAGLTSIAAGVIVNADVNASAAIARSKLAALTASRVLVSDGSGFDSVATTTTTEVQLLSGLTSVKNMTNWGATAWTPTGSWSTNCTYTGVYRRVGDTFEGRVNIALAGAPTAAPLTINLPGSHTIDTAKIPGFANSPVVGVGTLRDFGNAFYQGMVTYDSTTSVAVNELFITTHAGTVATKFGAIDSTNPITWGNADSVSIFFSVPIVEYA